MAEHGLSSDELFVLANNTSAVKAAVEKRAANIATRTRRDLGRAGVDAKVTIRDHPLATGRHSRDVAVTVADDDRRRAGRIVRRAAREVKR